MTTARVVLGYRGAQVLDYIETTLAETRSPPSYAMIREAFGFHDDAGVSRVVQRLERRGFIRRIGAGRSRRIRVMKNNK